MAAKTVGARVRAPLVAARRATQGWRARRGDARRAAAPEPARPASLLAHPLFSDLSPSEAAILSVFMSRQTIAAGTVVVRQGARDGDLYLIEAGRAEVRARDEAGASRALAILGPGDFFGEIAFLTDEVRTADVAAIEPLTVLRLGREAYAILSELAAAEELGRVGAARMRVVGRGS